MLLSTAAIAQDKPFTEVTLEQAVAQALKFSPSVVTATGDIETAAAAERRAFGAYLPSAGLNGRGNYNSSGFNPQANTNTSGNASISAGVSVQYDLFTGFRRRAERNAAAAQTFAAKAGLNAAKANLIFSVQAAFYDALRARELIDVAKARVTRAEIGVDAAQRRLQAGSATRSDVLRAQLELNTAKQSVLEQQTAHRTAGFALGRFIGLDGGATPSADASSQVAVAPMAGLESIVERLVTQAPVVKAAQAQVQAADAQRGAASSRYWPMLSASTGYDVFDRNLSGNIGSGWSVGVNLSYPLFDGFAREETVTRAQVAQRNAAAQLEDTRRMVRAEAERAVAAVTLAEQKVALARQAVEVAREDLRVQDERYKLGASTMLDFLASQTGLVEAENSLIGARFDYELAKASLVALAGETS